MLSAGYRQRWLRSWILFDEANVFANFLDGFILALIEDDLVLFEQVAALSVDGNDQGAKLVNMAVPQSFRHTKVTPLCIDDLFYFHGRYYCISGREYAVDRFEILAGRNRSVIYRWDSVAAAMMAESAIFTPWNTS